MRNDVVLSLRSHLSDGGHSAALSAVHSTDEALAALRRRLRATSHPVRKPEVASPDSAARWFDGFRMVGIALPILIVLLTP